MKSIESIRVTAACRLLTVTAPMLAGALIVFPFGSPQTAQAQIQNAGSASDAGGVAMQAPEGTYYNDINIRMTGVDDFMPPLVEGDREFSGNGPSIIAEGEVFVENNAVYRRIFMKAQEDFGWLGLSGGDSVARGFSTPKLVYQAPPGTLITKVMVPEASLSFSGGWAHRIPLAKYTDDDHWYDFDYTENGTFDYFDTAHTKSVRVRGDAAGNDIGVHTGIRVEWDTTIKVRTQTDTGFLKWAYIDLPRQVAVHVDHHTRGDRDFHGNGPSVVINSNLQASEGEIALFIRMDATEMGGDWSKGYGITRKVFYTPPQGFRIKSVTTLDGQTVGTLGNQLWLETLSYADDDHEQDSAFHEVLGRAMIIGDSKGDDINRMTRVEFNHIKHQVLVQLEPILTHTFRTLSFR